MEEANNVVLSNGISMPRLIQGLPLIMKLAKINKAEFIQIVRTSFDAGISAFDTSHDYGKSEEYLKYAFRELEESGVERKCFFVTSKIGNSQQYAGNIEKYVDDSLKTMGLDYLDLMLLHWPVPGLYIDNWKKLEKVYKKGKIKSIGIANAQIRHLKALLSSEIEIVPHVLQTEIHPFNSCEDIRAYCNKNKISLQSCSSLCLMIDKVKYNSLLNELGSKYGKSVAQIMLKWLLQNNVSPVFRAFKQKHIEEMKDLFDFTLSEDDMKKISGLNENYRYHPESVNCAGF